MPEDKNTYDAGFPAIVDVVSRPHDNIVLVYGNSSDDHYNALAFQITRTVRRIERVFDTFTIADTNTVDFGWFGSSGHSTQVTTPGDEVFAIDSRRSETMVEYGFAVPQDGVYVGMQTGGGDTVNGLTEGSQDDRSLSVGDLDERAGVLSDETYVSTPSASTDAVMPTTALSPRPDQGFIRIDSRENGRNRFYFGFENQSGAQVTIDVIGVGMAYKVRPITDEQTARDMIAGNGYRRRILNYGGFGNTTPNLPEKWIPNRVTVSPGELTPGGT